MAFAALRDFVGSDATSASFHPQRRILPRSWSSAQENSPPASFQEGRRRSELFQARHTIHDFHDQGYDVRCSSRGLPRGEKLLNVACLHPRACTSAVPQWITDVQFIRAASQTPSRRRAILTAGGRHSCGMRIRTHVYQLFEPVFVAFNRQRCRKGTRNWLKSASEYPREAHQ